METIIDTKNWEELLDFMQQEERFIHNQILEITGEIQFIISPADKSLFFGENSKYKRYVWNFRKQKALKFIDAYQEKEYDGSLDPEAEDNFDGYLYIVK
ncbi:MAG: hypothetical protein EBR94_10220 [Bacteroidetes bacterium]|nr:hypothetical protein [Bacteroidota bacterium]